MQKFFQYFTTVCVVILGLYGLYEGGQYLWLRFGGSAGQIQGSLSQSELVSYLEQISPIANQVTLTVQEVAPVLDKKDMANKQEALSKIASAKNRFQSLGRQMHSVKAPKELGPLHDTLTKALRDYANSFQLAEKGFRQENLQMIGEGISHLNTAANDFNQAAQKITRVPTKP